MSEQRNDPKDATNSAIELLRLISGYQISQAIHVAASLGIADHLMDGPVRVEVLATATACHPRSLYRLLRALAAAGIFHEGERRDFSLTAMGRCLCSGSAMPLAPLATFIGRPYMWGAWAHLLHSIRTGENAFRHAYGASNFEYRAKLPEEEAIFDRAMTGNSVGLADAIVASFDFSQCRLVVDVGGGQGAVLAAVLAANASVQGLLFDQPYVVARAQPVLQAAGVASRLRRLVVTFFKEVPSGANTNLLKAVLHDWDDVASASILHRCRQAIDLKGKLLIVERIIGPAKRRPRGKIQRSQHASRAGW
jgi:hypothetical protein